jgi:hypothetical protein
MPNPFSSDYLPPQKTTRGETASTVPTLAVETVATAETTQLPPKGIEPQVYGFEPQRYGLGKPHRVIVRGKVAIG